jgi:hypothetical protein
MLVEYGVLVPTRNDPDGFDRMVHALWSKLHWHGLQIRSGEAPCLYVVSIARDEHVSQVDGFQVRLVYDVRLSGFEAPDA